VWRSSRWRCGAAKPRVGKGGSTMVIGHTCGTVEGVAQDMHSLPWPSLCAIAGSLQYKPNHLVSHYPRLHPAPPQSRLVHTQTGGDHPQPCIAPIYALDKMHIAYGHRSNRFPCVPRATDQHNGSVPGRRCTPRGNTIPSQSTLAHG
jgi:hypothetical protein